MTARSVSLSSVESELFDDPEEVGAAAREHYGKFDATLDPGSLANLQPERVNGPRKPLPPAVKASYTFGDEPKTAAELAEAAALEAHHAAVATRERARYTDKERERMARAAVRTSAIKVESSEKAVSVPERGEEAPPPPEHDVASAMGLLKRAGISRELLIELGAVLKDAVAPRVGVTGSLLDTVEVEDIPPPCTSRWENMPLEVSPPKAAQSLQYVEAARAEKPVLYQLRGDVGLLRMTVLFIVSRSEDFADLEETTFAPGWYLAPVAPVTDLQATLKLCGVTFRKSPRP